MRYRKLGRTDLEVSVLGFGASPLGDVFSVTNPVESNLAVHYAIERGMNLFDVSPYYGVTLAEQRLGVALAGVRHKVILATKCGRYGADDFDFSARKVVAGVCDSLVRLKTDYIDLLQVHDVEFGDVDQIVNETLPALRALQQQGKARYIGITGYSLQTLVSIAKSAPVDSILHWGVYSVPAFGSEWYPREMYLEGSKINQHHVATYGPLTKIGYKDFIPMFKAEKFDPQAWAALFKESGARYVVPVFEHHDGFAMYDSDLSDWTAKKMGPHRDLVGELATAVRAQGMHLGASSHRIEHDWFLDGGRKQASDVNDPKYAAFYGPAHPKLGEDGAPLAEDWTYSLCSRCCWMLAHG
jgi:hypothetical protein